MKIHQDPSPQEHFGGRRNNAAQPTFLILHYTETETADEAADLLTGRKPHPKGEKVSAHYMVDEDGRITRFVDESKRAHHAGVSYWNGIEDINSHSIGIEIVNPGHRYGYRAFPPAQMDAVKTLCRDIFSRHDIPAHQVLAHSDVAPGRKIDPGELFPWRDLAAAGIGLWPAPLKEDFEKDTDEVSVRAALTACGYDPRAGFTDVLTAFQRHFHPEAFKTPGLAGQVTSETAARLYALLRMKSSL
ncbi:MAG: N-acetylmuramoyl-L-alanine amidase [Proteobacteria bacterium]|nr:N-acetylmuramoyl-L-alanine amidase [Pseudomonadota bacterium]